MDKYSDPAGGLCSGCYDHFQAPFTPSDQWQQYSFSWTQLMQQGFGDAEPTVCAKELYALQFQWPANASFDLCLDDVAFTTAAGTAPEAAASSRTLVAGGGCACRTSGGSAGGTSGLVLLGLLGLAGFRRKIRTEQ